MAMKGDLKELDFKDLLEQLTTLRQDKDRLKLLKKAVEETNVTCAQVKAFIAAQTYGDAKVEAAVVSYPHITDRANFESVVLAALPYKEDKAEVKKRLGL